MQFFLAAKWDILAIQVKAESFGIELSSFDRRLKIQCRLYQSKTVVAKWRVIEDLYLQRTSFAMRPLSSLLSGNGPFNDGKNPELAVVNGFWSIDRDEVWPRFHSKEQLFIPGKAKEMRVASRYLYDSQYYHATTLDPSLFTITQREIRT